MVRKIVMRVNRLSPDIKLYGIALCFMGFASAIVDAVLNNYLNETFAITSFQRAILEFPREFPGVLTGFVSLWFCFLPGARLAAVSAVAAACGLVCMAFFSFTFPLLLCWLFIFSLGVHLFLPLSSSIGMELAKEGAPGRRLGQFGGLRNIAAILGAFFVLIGFRWLGFSFFKAFLLAAGIFLCAAVVFFKMPLQSCTQSPSRPALPKFHREYRLFYLLNILYGTRKQIFLTFAPWVLVTIFHQPTQVIAMLIMTGGILGIVLLPIIGYAIDRFGERTILSLEAVILVPVCLAYGFAKKLFPESIALLITAGCFIIDLLLMAVGMARATYMKKIALHPSHVAPGLALGVTIDHLFSLSIALASGLIWQRWGYQWVFFGGACIAVINFFSARRVPQKKSSLHKHDSIAKR
ncbi:MAG: MFS transporter [Candidatus Ratteibacteria bacterium]|jgi:MFS family permease